MSTSPWIWTDVTAADLCVGDVVQDSYNNAAIVIKASQNKNQVNIMQMVGSDRGRFSSLPLYIRRLDTVEIADSIRESGRKVWRETHNYKQV